jgi:hypothetical protein
MKREKDNAKLLKANVKKKELFEAVDHLINAHKDKIAFDRRIKQLELLMDEIKKHEKGGKK